MQMNNKKIRIFTALIVLISLFLPLKLHAQSNGTLNMPSGTQLTAPQVNSAVNQALRNKADAVNGIFTNPTLNEGNLAGINSLTLNTTRPNPTSFTAVFDPVRSIINNMPLSYEFGGNINIGDANAIVGGSICPANIAPVSNTYCGGVAGYSYNLSPGIGGGYSTATGTAGYGGFGVTSGSAWGLVGLVTNAMGANPNNSTGFGGAAGNPALMTGEEIDFNTYHLPGGLNPQYVNGAGLLVQGTADNQARLTRGNSTVYGVQVQVLDANNYTTTACDGTGTQSHCWDASLYSSDGASFVALGVGATAINLNAAVTAPSQAVAFYSYSSGILNVGSQFLQANKTFVMQAPANGSLDLSINGIAALLVANATPASGATSLSLLANNNSGVGLYPVTLGAANSGGPGNRALVVPN